MHHTSFFAASLCAMLLSASPIGFAHPGHGQELTREAVVKRAHAEVDRLIEEQKIEQSWLVSRKAGEARRRTVVDGEEWIVTFDNPVATEAGKRRLYVFLTPSGDFIVANFTGR